MPVIGSSPEWIVPQYVGLIILICVISKSLKTSALTDNSCCVKEEEEVARNVIIKLLLYIYIFIFLFIPL